MRGDFKFRCTYPGDDMDAHDRAEYAAIEVQRRSNKVPGFPQDSGAVPSGASGRT